MRLLYCLLPILLLLGAPAAAQAPGPEWNPAPEIAALLAEDARLQRPVTLRIPRAPLSTVLAEIERQCEVPLVAARDVADEPAIVYMRERPAAEVLTHLAKLFDYTWQPVRAEDGEGARGGYRLYQDQRSLARERELREREQRKALEAFQRRLQLHFALTDWEPEALRRRHAELRAEHERLNAQWNQLPPEARVVRASAPEYRRMREIGETVSTYQWMQAPHRRLLVRIVQQVLPQYWDLLREEELLEFGTRPAPGVIPLPDDLARALRQAPPTLEMYRLGPVTEDGLRRIEARESELAARWRLAPEIRLRLEWALEVSRHGAGAGLQIKPYTFVPDGRAAEFAVDTTLTISAPWMELRALPLQAIYPESVPEVWKQDPLLGARRPFRVKAVHPWLRRRPVEEEGPTVRDLLPPLAETWQVDLVADAYMPGVTSRNPWPDGTEVALYEQLNRRLLETSDWSREGDVLHARNRRWYAVRRTEVPTREADRWEERLREQRRLSLADAAALALVLDDEQLQNLPRVLRERGVWLGEMFEFFIADTDGAGRGKRELLRAFGVLPPLLRGALLRAEPVPVAAMPADAQQWLRRSLRARRRHDPTHLLPADLSGVTLSLGVPRVERTVRRWDERLWATSYALDALPPPPTGQRVYEEGDLVPQVPGLAPPEPGETEVAIFELRWPSGYREQIRILLPPVEVLQQEDAREEASR
jgi:hypothetical protein